MENNAGGDQHSTDQRFQPIKQQHGASGPVTDKPAQRRHGIQPRAVRRDRTRIEPRNYQEPSKLTSGELGSPQVSMVSISGQLNDLFHRNHYLCTIDEG